MQRNSHGHAGFRHRETQLEAAMHNSVWKCIRKIG